VPSASAIGRCGRSSTARAERKLAPQAKCFRREIGAWRDRSPQRDRAGKDFAEQYSSCDRDDATLPKIWTLSRRDLAKTRTVEA
jgi:hypothetical protein